MMKTLHVFTEEPSAKNVFEIILPKLLPPEVGFRVYPHQGKQDLEKALRTTVPSISKIPGAKILITRDQDSSDCISLKNMMNDIIALSCKCDFYIRIVCKELESWFLGDLLAVQSAYPRLKPDQHQNKADFRNVDRIANPNKYLLKILPEYANRDNLPKLEVSESIAPFLDFDRNTSSSFNHTVSAIRRLIA
jgi:hypothetical protein